MNLQLTVIGCSGTYPAGGRVCSSYLVEHGGNRVVFDLGNGALSNLTRRTDLADLGAVVLSHLHPDHFVDVVAMAYALRFHPRGPLQVPLYGPPGTGEMVTRHLDEDSRVRFGENLRIVEGLPGQPFAVGSLDVDVYPSNHPAAARSLRISAGDRVIAYSGDSGGGAELLDCAAGADLFVCDATWSERGGPHPEGLHLTGAGAGRHARSAEVGRLLVTHVSPTEDREQVLTEAADAFDGETLLADDLQELVL